MVTDGDQYYFDPIGLFVEPGTTATWVNVSGAHSTVAYAESNDQAETTRIPSDAEPWSSEVLSEADATFEHTLETTGTYDYFCGPHKSLGMIGRLVVGEPGGPATEGQPPDGELPDSQTIVDQGAVSYGDFAG
ncbi:halocyanin [Halosimplex rubrum]|uniref:Halocyanin n=2 Tax=Halosimplex rubrum TaxID=869889 RepID=A0A7D5PCJ6_9EURY|nr:halocyanin [Halosimplex rubrum]